ncbi:MAG: HNH endonuclease signature motif containing protein [Phycisphaerales bacterium]
MVKCSAIAPPRHEGDIDRFVDKIDFTDDGCWNWTASVNSDGYGQFRAGDEKRFAHRVVYEWFVRPLDPDLTLDHLCRNRACVNPDHLEEISLKENLRRGDAFIVNARKTHCPQGHPYDRLDLRTGQRKCRRCQTAAQRRYKIRQQETSR